MNRAFLLKEISKPISKKEAISLAEQSTNSVIQLLELCLHTNYEIAFRAAWILELTYSAQPERLKEFMREFIDVYLVLRNYSCHRHFTKILMNLTRKNSQVNIFDTIDPEPLVEVTFGLMIAPETPVAVIVNCMDILYNLKDEFDWIAGELAAQIEFQLRNGSAALQSRGKKVLHRLSQRKS